MKVDQTRRIGSVCLVLALILAVTSGFVSRHHDQGSIIRTVPLRKSLVKKHDSSSSASFPTALRDRKEDTITDVVTTSKKSSLDYNTRKKLVAESIAPWRTLRLFLYGSLGSGAALGGFITLSGVAAALSGVRSDVDLNTEYLNLGIDFGAAIAFAVIAKYDYDKGQELNVDVETKIERKMEQAKIAKGMKSRDKMLSQLSLDVQVSVEGARQEATIGSIQDGARQHIILIAGNKKACKDALLGANLLKLDFSISNILVVPYDLTAEGDKQVRPSGGFGERPIWETQPYVARPVGGGWKEYIALEMADAVKQNGEKAKEEGIAIVFANTRRVIRRGVGKVPWRQMIEELGEEVAPTKDDDY